MVIYLFIVVSYGCHSDGCGCGQWSGGCGLFLKFL